MVDRTDFDDRQTSVESPTEMAHRRGLITGLVVGVIGGAIVGGIIVGMIETGPTQQAPVATGPQQPATQPRERVLGTPEPELGPGRPDRQIEPYESGGERLPRSPGTAPAPGQR
jgi:hypothetical protein